MATDIDALADEITKAMQEYGDDAKQIVEDTISQIGKEVLNDLKSNSIIPKRSGGYRKGFKIKKKRYDGVYKLIIYNKKYQLTHLLENGHIMPQGGRSQAFPHWHQAQAIADKAADRIKEALQK